MSECAQARPVLAKYCKGLGLEIGAGGEKTVPDDSLITLDLPQPYTSVGTVQQTLRGHCGDLSGFCDNVLDYIIQHHVAEDFVWPELETIVREWHRVLKVGGLCIFNNPNQQKFLAHCAATGQGTNDAHKEVDFSLEALKANVIDKTGPWEILFENPDVPPYSFYLVVKKL